MQTYKEQNFEEHIEEHLNRSGYRSGQSVSYSRAICMMGTETLQFIRETQPNTYQKLERQYAEETPLKLIDRISKQVEKRGVLDVLRNGVKDRGCHFYLTYFPPPSGMNLDLKNYLIRTDLHSYVNCIIHNRTKNRWIWCCSLMVCHW